ncbi:MAG: nickel-binding protein [Candidatus Bathyarchaeia archaeon]
MPKFLAVHPMPSPVTIEEATPLGKKAKSLCTADAYWVSSWAQLDEEGKIVKILCEWNAKDKKSVEKLIEKAEMPTEGVYPMMKVDSEDFR